MSFNVQERYGPEPFTALSHPITKMVGTFNWKGTIWPNDDDLAFSVDSEGTAQVELAADGRFIEMKWEGDASGERWSGAHAFGYDSGTAYKAGESTKRGVKEVFYNRFGNFGSGSGEHDGEGSVLEFEGTTHECGRGIEKYRTIFKVISDNEFTLEVHMTSGVTKEESKARHLHFTRV